MLGNKLVEDYPLGDDVKADYCNDVDKVASNANDAVNEGVHNLHPMQRNLDCKHNVTIDQMDFVM